MSVEEIINLVLTLFQVAVLFKIFILVLVFFYFIFALVVYRESSLMSQTLNSSVSPFIRLIAILHILVVVFLFFLALTIL